MALESLQVGTDTTHKGESVSCWLPAVFASSSNLPVCAWLSQCKLQLQHLNPLEFDGPGVFSWHQMQAGNTDISWETVVGAQSYTLLIPTYHLGAEIGSLLQPPVFWKGVSSGRKPHLQGVTLNSSAHILAPSVFPPPKGSHWLNYFCQQVSLPLHPWSPLAVAFCQNKGHCLLASLKIRLPYTDAWTWVLSETGAQKLPRLKYLSHIQACLARLIFLPLFLLLTIG